MDRFDIEDAITSCERQKDITEPESERVPESISAIHHTATLATGEIPNICDTWGGYVPMYSAARISMLNIYDRPRTSGETQVRENQLGHSLWASSSFDRLYDETGMDKTQIGSETGYTIAELLDYETLPQVLHITQGHKGGSEQESLTEGDIVSSYCLITRDVVLAESKAGIKFTIPIKSQHKFLLVPDNTRNFADVLRSSSQFSHCNTVADLAKLPQLPRVVRTKTASKGSTPDASVEKGMILLLQAVAAREGRVTLVARDLYGDERHLREKCKAEFDLRPRDTWLLIEEIVQHSSLPTKVFLVNHQMLADSDAVGASTLPDDDYTLRCQPLTLLCATKQTYLVVSKHNKSTEAPINSDLLLEVPTTLSIRVKCIPLVEEKQEKSLLQLAKTVHEHIQLSPGQLIMESSAIMAEEDHKLQELLYLTTYGHNTVEQIRLMVGGRPKVRLPLQDPLAVPVMQRKVKHKITSQDNALTEQDVRDTIRQLKTDIRKLEALVGECKDKLHRLELSLQAGNARP